MEQTLIFHSPLPGSVVAAESGPAAVVDSDAAFVDSDGAALSVGTAWHSAA